MDVATFRWKASTILHDFYKENAQRGDKDAEEQLLMKAAQHMLLCKFTIPHCQHGMKSCAP